MKRSGAPGPFLLFVASEPLRGDEGYVVTSQFHRLRAFLQLPPKSPARTRDASGRTLREPPEDVGRCLRAAVEVAAELGTTVRVIDLERPGEDAALVERYVRPESLLPLLVSPHGERLEGMDAFVPSRLRRFLSEAEAGGPEARPRP